MTDATNPTPIPVVERFASLASFRASHNDLLQAYHRQGVMPEIMERVRLFIAQGQATGALLDEENDRWIAQGLLDYWSATLHRAGEAFPDAALEDFDPELAPELPDEHCPYVGLDAFSEQRQALFFGRQRLIQAMLDKLTETRLLTVVGPSGSGKSSLVLAGLIPALKDGALAGSEQWYYTPRIVPGSDPLANLARLLETALAAPAEDRASWARLQVARLREDPDHLAALADVSEGVPVVMVVDQFEEVFTLCTDAAACHVFITGLIGLIRSSGLRHTVVLTMRTDFESFVARMPDFQSLFEAGAVQVTPLNAAELREAIEAPAARVGLKFETGLVDALLQDTLGEPAALPLLQFTLLKLWENRERNRITWEAYKRLGGGRLALARSADSFYNGLIPEEQVTARRIFMRLVRPGQGLEFTSNRVKREALFQAGEARDRVERVLKKLIAVRLVRLSEGDVSADAQVEVAHEALVRNWPRLVDWLEEERDIIRRRQRLTDAAEHWKTLGKDAGALLPVTLLHEASRAVESSGVQLNDIEAEFVQASQEAIEAAKKTELAREVELAQSRVRLEHEQKKGEVQAMEAMHFREMAIEFAWERYIIPAAIFVTLVVGAILAYVLSNRNASALLAYALTVSVATYVIVKRLEYKVEGHCALVIETGSGHKVRWGPTTYYRWPFGENVRALVPLSPLQYITSAKSIQLGADNKVDLRVMVHYSVDISNREMYQDEVNVLNSVYRVQLEEPSTADRSEAKPDSRSYTVEDLRRIWEKRLLKDIIATMIEVLPGRSNDELTGEDIQARTKMIDEARLRLAARVHQWGLEITDMGILDAETSKG